MSFRSGAPPPTHQSIIALNAFKLSSLAFFPAIVLRLSSALVLCIGLDCASKVSADNLSDSVPEARIFETNCWSEAEVVLGGGREEWRSAARERRDATVEESTGTDGGIKV